MAKTKEIKISPSYIKDERGRTTEIYLTINDYKKIKQAINALQKMRKSQQKKSRG